jgi:hypothetical protein
LKRVNQIEKSVEKSMSLRVLVEQLFGARLSQRFESQAISFERFPSQLESFSMPGLLVLLHKSSDELDDLLLLAQAPLIAASFPMIVRA